MHTMFKLLALVLCITLASATVHFSEDFGEGWENRWVQSKADDAQGTAGKFVATPGKHYADATDNGIQTSQDARFYKYSAAFPQFSNKDKPLVIQYTVKHEQDLDCGGSYIKVAPPGLDQENFNGESPYNVMFGPDKCGSTNRVHFIFNYKDKNHLWKKTLTPPQDKLTHVYTAIINPDQTYEVRIDGEKKESGSLVEDWDFLPPKEINDPEASKPEDWVDEKEIADPEASKPEGWDDIPKEIADPDAKKPDDWQDELDGEWETPSIPNPEYKGEWVAPTIPNPEYKGEWVHPKIPNPDYYTDDSIYVYDNAFVNFEIWQVKSGTIFDNILIADSVADAEAVSFTEQQAKEKAMFEEKEKEREEKEALEREAERKKFEEENPTEEAGDVEGEREDDDDDEEKGHDEL